MVNEMPACSDSARFGIMDACRALGIAKNTLRRAVELGENNGGIRSYIVPATGKRCISGKAIKDYYRRKYGI